MLPRQPVRDAYWPRPLWQAALQLRTPTAGILGLSEPLAADRVPAARKQSVYEMIRAQAKSPSTLVTDLLDLARLEARANKNLNMEEFDVQRIIDSVSIPAQA